MTPHDAIRDELRELRTKFPTWCVAGQHAAGMYQFRAIPEQMEFDPKRDGEWPFKSSWCGQPSRAARELTTELRRVLA